MKPTTLSGPIAVASFFTIIGFFSSVAEAQGDHSPGPVHYSFSTAWSGVPAPNQEFINGNVQVENGVIYFQNNGSDCTYAAYSARSGRKVWETPSQGFASPFQPLVVGGGVVLTSQNPDYSNSGGANTILVAYSATNGSKLWKQAPRMVVPPYSTPDVVYTPNSPSRGGRVTSSSSGVFWFFDPTAEALQGISAATGRLLFNVSKPSGFTTTESRPLVIGNRKDTVAVILDGDAHFVVNSSSGQMLFSHQNTSVYYGTRQALATVGADYFYLLTQPAHAGGGILYQHHNATLTAYSLRSTPPGRMLWSYRMPENRAPPLIGRLVAPNDIAKSSSPLQAGGAVYDDSTVIIIDEQKTYLSLYGRSGEYWTIRDYSGHFIIDPISGVIFNSYSNSNDFQTRVCPILGNAVADDSNCKHFYQESPLLTADGVIVFQHYNQTAQQTQLFADSFSIAVSTTPAPLPPTPATPNPPTPGYTMAPESSPTVLYRHQLNDVVLPQLVYSEGVVYFASNDSDCTYAARDANTFDLIWETPIQGFASNSPPFAVKEGLMFTWEGCAYWTRIRAYRIYDGAVVWETPVWPATALPPQPYNSKGKVAYTTGNTSSSSSGNSNSSGTIWYFANDVLWGLDALTGSIKHRVAPPPDFSRDTTIAGQYVRGNDIDRVVILGLGNSFFMIDGEGNFLFSGGHKHLISSRVKIAFSDKYFYFHQDWSGAEQILHVYSLHSSPPGQLLWTQKIDMGYGDYLLPSNVMAAQGYPETAVYVVHHTVFDHGYYVTLWSKGGRVQTTQMPSYHKVVLDPNTGFIATVGLQGLADGHDIPICPIYKNGTLASGEGCLKVCDSCSSQDSTRTAAFTKDGGIFGTASGRYSVNYATFVWGVGFPASWGNSDVEANASTRII